MRASLGFIPPESSANHDETAHGAPAATADFAVVHG